MSNPRFWRDLDARNDLDKDLTTSFDAAKHEQCVIRPTDHAQ